MPPERPLIVLLLVTRNEAGILRLNLAHHLAWGIDHIGVCDNNSDDHTQEVIRSFGDRVSSLMFDDFSNRQHYRMRCLDQITTTMGRRPDWIGVSDTDEFFWAPGTGAHRILQSVPPDVVAATSEQKLFVPTEVDPAAGVVYSRLLYRAATVDSPFHRSYREGKSFYRGAWLKQISSEHRCHEVPHPEWNFPEALVHHYMITDADHFVDKVRRLSAWRRDFRIRGSKAFEQLFRAIMGRDQAPFVADFKQNWWRILEHEGEAGLRAYYNQHFRVSKAALGAALQAGELVLDREFADYKSQTLAAGSVP